MYIYNVTVSIEKSLAEDWLNWMKTIHVPDVLNTGHFTENKICKVLNVDDEGATYSVQYTFNTMEEIEAYQKIMPLVYKPNIPNVTKENTQPLERYWKLFNFFKIN